MTSQSNYSRGSNRASLQYPSMNSADQFGATKDMGSSNLPPQPVEIRDLSITARTLPTTFPMWEHSSSLQTPGLGEMPYGSSVASRTQHNLVDSQTRGPVTGDPLQQWYANQDGPWAPMTVLKGTSPEENSLLRHAGRYVPVSMGSQYRQHNSSDAGSYCLGVPHSDSGYGTRKSVGTTSVFSGEFTDRDQETQSLVGHLQEFHPYQQYNNVPRNLEARKTEQWATPPQASPCEQSGLTCETCGMSVKTNSELKKHTLRHTKPHRCLVDSCQRQHGFSTTNDLDRHMRSKHKDLVPANDVKVYKCLVPGCKNKDKEWPRLDNFKSHLLRTHNLNSEQQEEFALRGESHGVSGIESQERRQQICQEPSQPAQPSTQEPALRSSEVPCTLRSLEYLTRARGCHLIGHNVLGLQSQDPQTVQPTDIYPFVRAQESNIRLDRTPSAQVSQANSTRATDDEDYELPPILEFEAHRQTEELTSAAKATVKDASKTQTARSNLEYIIHGTTERSPLPNGRSFSPHLGTPTIDKEVSVAKKIPATNHPEISDHSPPTQESEEASAELKIASLLAELKKYGYSATQDTATPSPKPQNAGSAASNKSDKRETCDKCRKFTGRPCEMRKHKKRHERPYGCTFLTCNKTFGSKNDWKRHENSQHYHLETWRCDLERTSGGEIPCAKICYRKQAFSEHLRKEHKFPEDEISEKLDSCRAGRNCTVRFWCGFCNSMVELEKKGLDGWTERFDHIDDHFMGKGPLNNEKTLSINEWVPMDNTEPKGQLLGTPSASSFLPENDNDHEDPPNASEESVSPPDSTFNAGPVISSSTSVVLQNDRTRTGQKRKASGSSDDGEPAAKQPKIKKTPTQEIRRFCCQCNMDHCPKTSVQCDCSHMLNNCCTKRWKKVLSHELEESLDS